LPGWDPQRLLERGDLAVRWVFHPRSIFLGMLLVLSAWVWVAVHFDEFRQKIPGFHEFLSWENLFIASGISKISIEEISLKALPFAFINTVAIFVIAFFPEISLWLPRFFGY
jgi:hypothetical protein